jgi:hypothetical protein
VSHPLTLKRINLFTRSTGSGRPFQKQKRQEALRPTAQTRAATKNNVDC